MYDRSASQIQDILDGGSIPEWLTESITVLIMKNRDIGPNVASNYHPITCLSNIWKLIASILADEILCHLDACHSWPWDRKGAREGAKVLRTIF